MRILKIGLTLAICAQATDQSSLLKRNPRNNGLRERLAWAESNEPRLHRKNNGSRRAESQEYQQRQKSIQKSRSQGEDILTKDGKNVVHEGRVLFWGDAYKSFKQKGFGNCYFLAGMASILAQNALNNCCRIDENGRYKVEFRNLAGQGQIVEVDLSKGKRNGLPPQIRKQLKYQCPENEALRAILTAHLIRYRRSRHKYDVDGGFSAQSFANDWGMPSTTKDVAELTYEELEGLWKDGSPLTVSRIKHAYGIVHVSNGLITVLEPNHVSQNCPVRKSAPAWMPEGSTVVEDGIYSMDFQTFQKDFGTIDIGYFTQFPEKKMVPLNAINLDAVIATGEGRLSRFDFKTNHYPNIDNDPFLSWTVSGSTQAVVQILQQDHFVARDQDETLWANDIVPHIYLTSVGTDGRDLPVRCLSPTCTAWGNNRKPGKRLWFIPGVTYSLQAPPSGARELRPAPQHVDRLDESSSQTSEEYEAKLRDEAKLRELNELLAGM